jgi:hypothetical protein
LAFEGKHLVRFVNWPMFKWSLLLRKKNQWDPSWSSIEMEQYRVKTRKLPDRLVLLGACLMLD